MESVQVDVERPRKAAKAARVFHSHIREIAGACVRARHGQMVVAEVLEDLSYGGATIVGLSDLYASLTSRDRGQWVIVFRSGESLDRIEKLCIRMGYVAYRWKIPAAWRRKR